MSATTHGLTAADDFGDSVANVVRAEAEPPGHLPARFEAGAGDEWGTVLAVAVLLVVLIVGALLLGGG